MVVTGSLGYDHILNFPGKFVDRLMPDKLHAISVSFLADRMTRELGGTAGNIAYSLKLLGLEPIILACLGSDSQEFIHFYRQHQIETTRIKIVKSQRTGTSFVVTDRTDSQIAAFYMGAISLADQLHIPATARYVVISPTKPEAMVQYVAECIKLKVPYLYDPAFQIEQFSGIQLKRGIAHADFLIGNDYEVALIEKKLRLTHHQLTSLVPLVVTTLGSQGALIEQGKQKIRIKAAKPLNTTDPTGAGDAFRAGFLAGYLRKLDLTICGQMGATAAVYTVEKYGTVTHHYSIKEFTKRYQLNYQTALKLK